MSNPSQGKAVRESALGLRVVKTAAVDATADDLFDVVGEVLVTLFYGIVTGVGDGTVETILVNEKASTLNLCAATTVTSDAVGEIYRVTGDHAVILNGTGNIPRLKVASLLSAFPATGGIIFDGQDGLVIELTATDGSDATLAVKWVVFYIPLEDGAYVAPAA
jgi:hypothetical protein